MSQAIIDQAFVIVRLRKWGEGWRTNALAKQTEVETLRTKMRVMDEEHTALAGERDQIRANLIQTESESRAAFDELRVQVQDQRAEIERLQWENKTMHKDAEDGYAEAIKVLGDPIALSKERDALRAEVAQHQKEHTGDQQAIVGLLSERDKLRAEVAALKHEVDTLSCPYVSGQRVRVKSEGGLITQQSEYGIGKIGIINAFAFVARIGSRGWVDVQDIEPCDPPADHDTPAGKEAAESVIRDSQITAIKVGDVVEVFQSTRPATTKSDIKAIGIVTAIIPGSDFVHEHVVLSDNGDPATRLPFAGMASLRDVRKVTQ